MRKVFPSGALSARGTNAPCNNELILKEESVTALKLGVEGQNTQLHAPPSVQVSHLGGGVRALALGMTSGAVLGKPLGSAETRHGQQRASLGAQAAVGTLPGQGL